MPDATDLRNYRVRPEVRRMAEMAYGRMLTRLRSRELTMRPEAFAQLKVWAEAFFTETDNG